jgi:hemolysin D
MEYSTPSSQLKPDGNVELQQLQSTQPLGAPPSELAESDGWSLSTQEQLDALPKVWTRGLLYFLVFFTAIALPWAILSKVDVIGTAEGRLESKGSPIRIDAPIAGTVVQVRAAEGQEVRKGQVLLELQSETLRAELQQAQAKLQGQKNQLLQFQQGKIQMISAVTAQQRQNQAQASEKTAQLNQSTQALDAVKTTKPIQLAEKLAQVNQARQALIAAKTAYGLAKVKLQKDQVEVARYHKLWQQGAVAEVKVGDVEKIALESQILKAQAEAEIKLAYERLQEQRSSHQKLLRQSQAEETQAETRLQELRSNQQALLRAGDLALLKAQEQLQNIERQVASIETEIKQTYSQIANLQTQVEQTLVRSPNDGVLLQFPIKRPETYVQPGQMLAHIAPEGTPLLLKALIPVQDSGFLKVGLPVKLKFEAYPFKDYGIVAGHLSWISPDSKVVEGNQGKAEVFEIEVELYQSYIQARNKEIPLTAGQRATAEVIIRQRRIIDFLIDPFKQLQKDGLKL